GGVYDQCRRELVFIRRNCPFRADLAVVLHCSTWTDHVMGGPGRIGYWPRPMAGCLARPACTAKFGDVAKLGAGVVCSCPWPLWLASRGLFWVENGPEIGERGSEHASARVPVAVWHPTP